MDVNRNFMTERHTVGFNGGLASSEGLILNMQSGSNKKPDDNKSTELKERIFQSYHSKLNSNIKANLKSLSPDTKNDFRQTGTKLNTNNTGQKKYFSNGKVYTENVDMNSYVHGHNVMSQNDRDLTPQSSRNRQEQRNNTGSKKITKETAKVPQNFMTPSIENNKNHFFSNFNNQHLSNSPTIKENISKFISV